jgi:hypothetical protein
MLLYSLPKFRVMFIDYIGWVPTPIVDAFADNVVNRTTNALKKELERRKSGVDLSSLTVEEAAKKLFVSKLVEQKKLENAAFEDMIDSSPASKAALEDRVRLLEKQLKDSVGSQMPPEVRQSIDDHLARTKARLRNTKA